MSDQYAVKSIYFSKVCFKKCQNVKKIVPPNCSEFGNSLPETTEPTDCQKLARWCITNREASGLDSIIVR